MGWAGVGRLSGDWVPLAVEVSASLSVRCADTMIDERGRAHWGQCAPPLSAITVSAQRTLSEALVPAAKGLQPPEYLTTQPGPNRRLARQCQISPRVASPGTSSNWMLDTVRIVA